MRPLSETTARQTIAMMRSIASHKPITPFHLMAADQMEQLLEEVSLAHCFLIEICRCLLCLLGPV